MVMVMINKKKDCIHVNTLKYFELHLKRRYIRHCIEKAFKEWQMERRNILLKKKKKTKLFTNPSFCSAHDLTGV